MVSSRWLVVGALSVSSFAAGQRQPESAFADSVVKSAPLCLPGRSAAHLDTVFYSEPAGVIGADYQRAFTMPDGRVLWTFQDAAIRVAGDDIRIVHNIAAVQDGQCFTMLYRGARSAPRSFFFADRTDPFHRWFWPLDATELTDGRIGVFMAEMDERGADYLTRTVPIGTWIAVFDPATDAVVSETRPSDGSADLYGWSVTSDATWTYLYAQCYRQFGFDIYIYTYAFDRSCATEVTVARVPLGQVFTPPEYWDGATWQPDPARAAPIIDQAGRRINANQFEWTGAGFVSVNNEGDWWGDTIYLSRSLRPTGPFEVYDTIRAPLKCSPVDCNSFFATWVPAVAAQRPLGRFVVSIAHNRWDGVITSLYRPSFFDVDAPPHLPAGGTIERTIDGDGGAVVLNVGVVEPSDRGYLTVYPCDRGRPSASSVNHINQPVVSNLVIARPDASGRVCVFTRSETDVIVDQTGSFALDAGFVPVDRPVRIADTREGIGVARARVPARGVVEVAVPGGADRTSVLNVIAVNPSASGYLTVFECDREVPGTSNVNYVGEPVVSNLVVTPVGVDGSVCIYSLAETDVVVDLAGSFEEGGFDALDEPTRILDTRDPTSSGRLGDRDTVAVRVPVGAAAAVMNVVAVAPDGPGFVTVYPCDVERPGTSNVNHITIPVVSNVVIARASADGRVCIYSSRASDIVVDLFGVLPTSAGFAPLDVPTRIVDTRNGTGTAGQLGIE